ncbi:hypothetical protein [Tautonia marina]|uniref:hypothetical protein n=1 Tax=Tautonia marina TaxID=2653855 RepID=UPI0012610A16|nr:hypothetical protein [Tautonia marina]
MKRLLKSLVRPVWGWTVVVRRPIVRKFDQKLERMLGECVRDPIAHHLHLSNVSQHEMNIALNSCIREIARLEMQVEELRLELARDRDASLFEATSEAR